MSLYLTINKGRQNSHKAFKKKFYLWEIKVNCEVSSRVVRWTAASVDPTLQSETSWKPSDGLPWNLVRDTPKRIKPNCFFFGRFPVCFLWWDQNSNYIDPDLGKKTGHGTKTIICTKPRRISDKSRQEKCFSKTTVLWFLVCIWRHKMGQVETQTKSAGQGCLLTTGLAARSPARPVHMLTCHLAMLNLELLLTVMQSLSRLERQLSCFANWEFVLSLSRKWRHESR